MDLKKFKLLSVFLLAIAVLFLSVNLIKNKTGTESFDYSVAEDISALFAAVNVELSPEAIPLSREKLPVYSAKAADGNTARQLAELVSGSKKAAANLTDDGYLFRLENGEILEVGRDLTLSYNKTNQSAEGALTREPTEAAKAKAIALINRFTSLYDGKNDVLCDYRLVAFAPVGSSVVLKFDIFLNGVELFENSLSIYQDANDDVLFAYGRCLFSPLEKENGFRHNDVIVALKTEVDRIRESGPPSEKIESVNVGYIARTDGENELIYFIPAWKIEYSNGEIRFYEAARND